ncbi:putative tetratricopeptide-like helical domain-containing protein [Rosa chinensis]|uniref:Putative tetratricopeptide-like helical domain-containing protein n=1 Tax=Rosa chinensis TaxID=74649 RepID=A0A2P6SP72_ROSCH|nr:nephrocystin-3 [Rosa chinensis]XP_024177883.1 nephrocystin-3 [Rosa chinensis]PRQ60462.1 putative tetratricopeptide-like helical domain-containing protein [Rosa chinensis]
MAASLLLPSHFFNTYRISKLCLHHMQSANSHKGITCLFPVRALASRSFASVGSVENHVSAPNKTHRSEGSKTSDGTENDFERELQELFDEVKMLVMNGNKDDAVDLLRANYEAVKERMDAGVRGIEEAATIDIIALGYMAIGDFKFVESLLDMLNEIVGSLKDDEPLLDSVLVHMGSMYSTLAKFEKSMLVYRRAIDNMENMYGKNSVFLITPILGMAKVLSSIGRTTKAVELYHRAITLLESSRGAESEDLVIPLFGLGSLLLKQGKPIEAETPFLRILNIYTKLYGEDDGRVGMAMSSLARAKCAMGKANEAIDLYKKALKVIKDSNYMASDDSIVEKMRIDLAELLHAVGRGKEGRELLEECLLITEKHKGKEDPSSVTHLINLATSHSRSKNYVEAERLLRTSLQVLAKTVAPDDQSISFPILHLAVTLYQLKRDEEAEQLALQALHIREKAFGKDSLPVAEALDCLVSIQTRLTRDDEALLDQLERVLSIQEKEFGPESKEVLTTLKKVVHYLDKLGRKNDKLLLQKRLSALRSKFKQQIQQ